MKGLLLVLLGATAFFFMPDIITALSNGICDSLFNTGLCSAGESVVTTGMRIPVAFLVIVLLVHKFGELLRIRDRAGLFAACTVSVAGIIVSFSGKYPFAPQGVKVDSLQLLFYAICIFLLVIFAGVSFLAFIGVLKKFVVNRKIRESIITRVWNEEKDRKEWTQSMDFPVLTISADAMRDSLTALINEFIRVEKSTTGLEYQQRSNFVR